MITRLKALQMLDGCKITSLGQLAHGYVVYQTASSEIINQVFDSLEQRNAELEQRVKYQIEKYCLLANKHIELKQRVKELEHPNTCGACKYWYEKSCSNNDGIAYNAANAVYEDDYCKDYEPK